MWGGEGLSMLGVQAGTAATEAQVRAVFGRLEHPTRVDPKTGEPAAAGEPAADLPAPATSGWRRRWRRSRTPPRNAARRSGRQVSAQTRKAVAYYDLTFSPVKSVSVYWAALLEAGRTAEAAERRRGAPGRGRGGDGLRRASRPPTCGRAITARPRRGSRSGSTSRPAGWSWIRWDHSTSRAQQPQLHSHVTVLNRAETISDGVIRALASRGFKPIKQAADAIYTKVYEETADRLERGGVRDPPGRQGARDRRVQLAAAGQGVLPHRRHHGAAGRARRAVPRRPTGGIRARSRPGGSTAPRGGRPARRRTTRWRRADRWRPGRQPVRERAGPRRWPRPTPPARGSRATGTPSSRATRRATGSRCCARRCAPCSSATPRGTSGTWPRRSPTSRSAPRRSPRSPPDLAAEVLREGDRYGVVMLSVRDVGTVPAELRRPDGLNRYRMRNAEEYATTAQLETEASIVERARGTGAAALSGPALELARVELQAAGLVGRPAGRGAADPVVRAARRRADRPGRSREVPHGRRAGPGVGAAGRRPGPRVWRPRTSPRGCSSRTGSTR